LRPLTREARWQKPIGKQQSPRERLLNSGKTESSCQQKGIHFNTERNLHAGQREGSAISPKWSLNSRREFPGKKEVAVSKTPPEGYGKGGSIVLEGLRKKEQKKRRPAMYAGDFSKRKVLNPSAKWDTQLLPSTEEGRARPDDWGGKRCYRSASSKRDLTASAQAAKGR